MHVKQQLPASYTGFFYLLEGTALIGAEKMKVSQDQVGWIDRPSRGEVSVIEVATTDSAARVVMYMEKPQNEPLIHHGPFLAGDRNV